MNKLEKEKIINNVSEKLAQVIKSVTNSNLETTLDQQIAKKFGSYIPTPFEIAELYGIRYKFVELNGKIPSYMSPGLGTIYISDKYSKNSYEAKYLCAHELGHFFMQNNDEYVTMSIDESPETSPTKVIKEYEANIFAILLMPQFMHGIPWTKYSPQKLNKIVYNRAFKRDG